MAEVDDDGLEGEEEEGEEVPGLQRRLLHGSDEMRTQKEETLISIDGFFGDTTTCRLGPGGHIRQLGVNWEEVKAIQVGSQLERELRRRTFSRFGCLFKGVEVSHGYYTI